MNVVPLRHRITFLRESGARSSMPRVFFVTHDDSLQRLYPNKRKGLFYYHVRAHPQTTAANNHSFLNRHATE